MWNFTGDYIKITLELYRSFCLHGRGSWHFWSSDPCTQWLMTADVLARSPTLRPPQLNDSARPLHYSISAVTIWFPLFLIIIIIIIIIIKISIDGIQKLLLIRVRVYLQVMAAKWLLYFPQNWSLTIGQELSIIPKISFIFPSAETHN